MKVPKGDLIVNFFVSDDATPVNFSIHIKGFCCIDYGLHDSSTYNSMVTHITKPDTFLSVGIAFFLN